MLEQFKGFIGYTDEEFKELWEEAVFVIDTNILINFYKYTSKESTQSLLDILKKLKETNRLWIPHQVALEYFFNYEDNMFKPNEGYELLGKELAKLKGDAKKTLNTVKSKHPYIMTERFQFFIESIEQSDQKLQEQLKKEIDNLPDANAIQEDLLNLLDEIIGEPYSQKRIDEIEKEGKNRYQHDVPPGFKDKTDNNKQDFRTYGNFRYQQLYGDLIVWYQIIDRAKDENNPTPIILITEDRKEDWWEKDGSKIKRPHPQLIQEFINKTQQNFYMYRTENFVRNAMEYLEVDVTEEQYKEVTMEIENIRKIEDSKIKKVNSQKQSDIDKVLEYLTENERGIYQLMVTETYGLPFDITVDFVNFTNAVKWAKNIALPRIERKFQELITHLTSINKEKGEQAQYVFNSLPEDSDERIVMLLEEIEEILKTIEVYNLIPGLR
ncbi:PIN-like domain-containing protein [Bacillus cereus]|nr:PIN-like domain-containing protein [Bacillus cereus]